MTAYRLFEKIEPIGPGKVANVGIGRRPYIRFGRVEHPVVLLETVVGIAP